MIEPSDNMFYILIKDRVKKRGKIIMELKRKIRKMKKESKAKGQAIANNK